jgi:hypothetical protein
VGVSIRSCKGNGGRVVRGGCVVSGGTGSVVTVQSPSMVSENLSEKALSGGAKHKYGSVCPIEMMSLLVI